MAGRIVAVTRLAGLRVTVSPSPCLHVLSAWGTGPVLEAWGQDICWLFYEEVHEF